MRALAAVLRFTKNAMGYWLFCDLNAFPETKTTAPWEEGAVVLFRPQSIGREALRL
jgi:hypothetical protein